MSIYSEPRLAVVEATVPQSEVDAEQPSSLIDVSGYRQGLVCIGPAIAGTGDTDIALTGTHLCAAAASRLDLEDVDTIRDQSGAPIAIELSYAGWYDIPATWLKGQYLVLLPGNALGELAAQPRDRALRVMLKS